MKVLSLFDGISCGRVALERAKLPVTNYYSSEIKQSALLVANDNYPQDANNRLGDITRIKGTDLPKIDLLMGGSPCQNLSIANMHNREGLKGEKSGLFYEYVRLLNEVKPKYFLLENVVMPRKDATIVSKLLGVEPILINSAIVSAAFRPRLYWTNIKQDLIKKVDIELKDILTSGYSPKTKARTLLARDGRADKRSHFKAYHRYSSSGFGTLIFKDCTHYKDAKKHYNKYFINLLAVEIDKLLLKTPIDLSVYEGVRYLNRTEREVCQTLPLNYTKAVKDTLSYELTGDCWTISVIAHLLKNIK